MHVAKFLSIGDSSIWPRDELANDSANFLSKVAASKVFEEYVACSLFREQARSWDDLENLQSSMKENLGEINWDRVAKQIEDNCKRSFQSLKIANTNKVTLKNNGAFAWFATATFLEIKYPKPDSRFGIGFSLEKFHAKWLPELYTRPISIGRPKYSTGQDPLDPKNTIDPQRRVFTWGSGHTKKPGSHHDNRGHR
jgi:hypothetical protein